MPGNGRPFEKGNKAGVGHGRPKGSGRIQICAEFAEKEGFEILLNLARGKYKDQHGKIRTAGWAAPDPKQPARIVWIGPSQELSFDALKLALAYGKGKPTEFVDISSGGQSLSEWANEWFASASPSANGHTNGNGHGPAAPNGNGNGPGLLPVPGEDTP